MQPTDRPTLGVVAISFDEEEDLPGFLANLTPWVDEIVIVDDGSSDATAAIAAAGGDKVRFIPSPRASGEYYSHQRNKGIAAAESEWLLHMDIDERVSGPLASEILSAIRAGSADAFRFRRRNYFLHRPMRGGGWQRWNQEHLARREVLTFGGMFHETCALAEGARVGQLRGWMNHLNDASFEERMRKSASYHPEVMARLRESGVSVGLGRLMMDPVAAFLRSYLALGGFRDGVPGFIFAVHSATARFRALASLWGEQHEIPRASLERDLAEAWEKEGPRGPGAG